MISENSADISKRNDHHRDGHHNETKTQGNLIQLVVTIRHGLFTDTSLLSNLCLQTTQHVRLTTNQPFKTMQAHSSIPLPRPLATASGGFGDGFSPLVCTRTPRKSLSRRCRCTGITTAAISAILSPETSGAVVETRNIQRVPVPADPVLRGEVVLGFTGCFSPERIKPLNAQQAAPAGAKTSLFTTH